MREIIYLDVYFGLNFVMDLVTVLITGLVAGERVGRLRLLAASFFGAAVSAVLLPGLLPQWIALAVGLFAVYPMNRIAFGKRTGARLGKLCLFSVVTSLFLGGAVEMLGYYGAGLTGSVRMTLPLFLVTALLGFGCYTAWGARLSRRLDSTVVELSIHFRGCREELCALVDSGAFLRDPVSGDPVLILKAEFAGSLFEPEEMARLKNSRGEEGFFPIPFRTAAGRGMLFAFRPEAVRFYGKGKKNRELSRVLVALDFTEGGFAGCPCLVPLGVIQ